MTPELSSYGPGMADALHGERVWRRSGRSRLELTEVSGEREPHPVSGFGIEDGFGWEDKPAWFDDLAEDLAAELAGELNEAGWNGRRPTARRTLLDPGKPPAVVRRSAWLARFNPGLSVGQAAVFDDSDPVSFYPWANPTEALTWMQLSAAPGRTSQAAPGTAAHTTVTNLIRDIAPGDLIFVLRSAPSDVNKKATADPLGWPREAHLVGVWWAELKAEYPHVDGNTYPETCCVPLVEFDQAVRVPLARRWVPALQDISALRVSGGLKSLREGEAFALAAACSLPMEIFTVENADLPALAAELRRLETGPIKPMRDYVASATARYETIRDIELAAMTAVKDLYLERGYAVADVSRQRRIGYDLAAGHPSREEILFEIEVKGTDKASDGAVALTDHEYAAAKVSAAASDLRWWLFTVTQARHPSRLAISDYAATEVVPAWANRVVNAGAATANPLRRLDRLAKSAWGTAG